MKHLLLCASLTVIAGAAFAGQARAETSQSLSTHADTQLQSEQTIFEDASGGVLVENDISAGSESDQSLNSDANADADRDSTVKGRAELDAKTDVDGSYRIQDLDSGAAAKSETRATATTTIDTE
tara:strand:- start:41329 stop:41703 length:375 start_codon:yes stop_codon:yes gene_type:complete